MSGFVEMPRYQCHKVVRAAKIVRAEHADGNAFVLTLELPDGSVGPRMYLHNGKPTNASGLVGGYLVQYDYGYESWSPGVAFESGYTLIRETVTAEAKAVVAEARRESKVVKS